jgi:DNA-binding IscR family transcriptional regulator
MHARFTVAAHVLALMAVSEKQKRSPMTSCAMAQSVGTHAVVVRRVLLMLKQRGLIATKRGSSGGTVLARDPSDIHLRHVYEAVMGNDDDAILGVRTTDEGPSDCPLGPVVKRYLTDLERDAHVALLRSLEAVTVAQMARTVSGRVRRSTQM